MKRSPLCTLQCHFSSVFLPSMLYVTVTIFAELGYILNDYILLTVIGETKKFVTSYRET